VIGPEVNDDGGIAVHMLFRYSSIKSVLLIAIDIAQAASAKHASVVDTCGKFAAGVVDTGGNLPPVSLTPVANLPWVSLTPVVHLDLRISANFRKNSK
jgi:hypothetical protein